MLDLQKTLGILSDTTAPAGHEYLGQEMFCTLLRPYVDEIQVDTLGNIIGKKSCGKQGAKQVLLDAHMDEIGFVVTGHKGKFLSLSSVGSIDSRHLCATKLCLFTNPPQFGVIATMPPHLLKDGDMDKTQDLSELLLDIGLSAEKTKEIPIGTPLVYATKSQALIGGRFCGKALDNRAGMAAILATLSKLPENLNVDVTVLFSAQEEIGLRGAKTAVFAQAPDLAIVLDVTFGDTPDSPKEKTVSLGKGPAIGVGPYLSRTLSNGLIALAKKHNIPHQLEILPGRTATNADEIQVAHTGIETALLSLPLRYMHSPTETVSVDDLEQTAALIIAFLAEFGGVA